MTTWLLLSIVSIPLGLVALAGLAWFVRQMQPSECSHEWSHYEVGGTAYRGCLSCDRVERFDPDAGGNTAGHWDHVPFAGS